jgi:hypothetical protein
MSAGGGSGGEEGGPAMAADELDGRHMEMLKVLNELAENDPDGVADMDKAAQKLGMNTVGREQDREEFVARARALEEAGYVEKAGSDLAANYGRLSVTEEGHKKLESS